MIWRGEDTSQDTHSAPSQTHTRLWSNQSHKEQQGCGDSLETRHDDPAEGLKCQEFSERKPAGTIGHDKPSEVNNVWQDSMDQISALAGEQSRF
jgi:hypothetical protein